MKAILRSIKPNYCALIAAGRKTKEVRKTIPKEVKFPYKVYIYCTKGNEMLIRSREHGVISLIISKTFQKAIDFRKHQILNGKVIGEYICNEITEVRPLVYPFSTEGTCLSGKQIFDYAGSKQIFFEHISDLVIYDKPRELSEFYKPYPNCTGDCYDCSEWVENYIKHNGKTVIEYNGYCGHESESYQINRPPQSFCYVEEIN